MENTTTYSPTTLYDQYHQELICDAARQVLEIIFFVVLSGIVGVLGFIANIINVIVFLKQGLNDTVNISLLGLAVSDLGALITLVWMSVCFNPLFVSSGIPFDSIDIQYLTAGWPHVCFARITSWITVYVTFERCIAIALPLKVKTILTPRRTIFTITTIFIVMIGSVSPVYYAIGIGPKYFPDRNETLQGLVYVKNGPYIENISFSITAFAQLSSFPLVIIFTAILIHNLLLKSKWRTKATNNSTSSAKDDTSSRRDKKVVKMVTFISCIFILCFMPSAINLVLMLMFSPDYSIVGPYKNSFLASWSILNTLEATNSSVNILVYYNMSGKYRTVFDKLLRRKKGKY